MGKKAKGGNPALTFRKIKETLEAKRFSEAATILRKAKFPPKERKKANQLNIDIHYFWALDYFEQKEYLQAVTILRMFVERFKKKINLPLEKANMLLGLSYFYTNDFVKAADYLVTAKQKPATHSFYFYYLLTLIYQKKYTDLTALEADHEKELAYLTENQKSYLAVAMALVQADFEKATTLLNDWTATDDIFKTNAAALTAILQGKNYSTAPEKIKPLYKSFLKIPLTEAEKEYLSQMPALETQVEKVKNSQLQTQLVVPLEKLCSEGISLPAAEFEQCMELPEMYRSYLVYNQIAALYNEDIEETEDEIIPLLKKYERYFFQVPESVFLFAQIFYWSPENFTKTFFWKNIESSLDRFGKTFTPHQLNRLSWRLLGCLDEYTFMGDRTADRKQNNLVKAYPQMLGLKWSQVTESIFSPSNPLPQTALDIFTYPNFQHGSGIVKDKWESSLEGLYPDPGFISMLLNSVGDDYYLPDHIDIDGHLNGIYAELLGKAQYVLIKATTEYQVHLKNRVVLDLFKLTNHAINKFEKEQKVNLNKKIKTRLFEAYGKMIDLFEENQPDSEYLQDYKILENAPKINHLTDLANDNKKDKKKLIDAFRQYIREGDSPIVHQVLLDELRYSKTINKALENVLIYFSVLLHEPAVELENIVRQFANSYVKKLRLPYVPKYPDSNYFDILEKLTKENTTPPYISTIGVLTEVYLPYMTRQVEPMYYNMAEKILSFFIKAKKKRPNFAFNQKLIQELMDFVGEAVAKRKLKKLGATLADAKKVFGKK